MVHVIIQQIICQEVLIMMYMPSLFGENLVDDFFDNFDHDWFTRPVQGRQAASLMRTDIRESDHDFTMAIELPGYKKEDLKLELNDGYLNITAQHNENRDEKDENGKLIRQERYSGSMQRSFYVGEDIKEEDVKARFEDGVLKLTIPKKEVEKQIPQQRTIAIEG